VACDHGLDRQRAITDPAHHFEFFGGERVFRGMPVPVRRALDEKCRAARISVWHLHDEVVAEPGTPCQGVQNGVVRRAAQHVGDAGDSRFVPEPRGHDLRVEPFAQVRLGKRDLQPKLRGQRFRRLIEHHEDRFTITAPTNEVVYLGMAKKVVVDLLHRPPRALFAHLGHEETCVTSIERIVVADVVKIADPRLDAEQIKRRGGNEIGRRLIRS
jgi:hypothetical protein